MTTQYGPEFYPMRAAHNWTQPDLSYNPAGLGASKRHPTGPVDSGAEPLVILTRVRDRVVAARGTVAPTKFNAMVPEQAHRLRLQSSQSGRAHRISTMLALLTGTIYR